MAYTILNTDGTTLLLLADNTVDQLATSLSLVGKNVNSYGEYFNNNFVKLLANSANTAGSPPRSPLKGQLWYDTTAKRLKVYDSGFKSVSGAIVSADQPNELTAGDIWFDTSNNQLKVYAANTIITIGPTYTKNTGEIGWILPANPILNSDNTSTQVTLLKSYGKVLGLISDKQFTASVASSTALFNTSTATVVAGLTIVGDVQYTGKITNNYLSMTVDITGVCDNALGSHNFYETNTGPIAVQNGKIADILEALYPINSNTGTIQNSYNLASIEKGVPVGSEARVLVGFPLNGSANIRAYQLRKFIALPNSSWDAKYVSGTYTATNTIYAWIGQP